MCDFYFDYSLLACVALLCAGCGCALAPVLLWPEQFRVRFWPKAIVLVVALVAVAARVDVALYRTCLAGGQPGPGDGFKIILLMPVALSLCAATLVLRRFAANRASRLSWRSARR